LLLDDQKRTTKLERALLVLSELAHTHEMRKEEIDREMQGNEDSITVLLRELGEGKRSKADVKERMLSLDMKNRYLRGTLKRSNENLINTRRQEDVVRDFSASILTNQRMAGVVSDLSSVGFKINTLDQTTDRVSEMFENMNEINRTAAETATADTEMDYHDMDAEATDSVNMRIQEVEDLKQMQLQSGLERVSLGMHASSDTKREVVRKRDVLAYKSQFLDSPHSIGGMRSDADEDNKEDDDDDGDDTLHLDDFTSPPRDIHEQMS